MGGRRPRLSLLGLALAVVIACAVVSPSASAATPSITSGSVTIPVHPLDGVCPFELQSGSTFFYTERDYLDSNGNLIGQGFHLREQDTFSNNGVTLTSDWWEANFDISFDAEGNPTIFINGIVERVHLPDGSLFISAGRVDYSADGFPDFVIAPDQGGIHNLNGFCAALAG